MQSVHDPKVETFPDIPAAGQFLFEVYAGCLGLLRSPAGRCDVSLNPLAIQEMYTTDSSPMLVALSRATYAESVEFPQAGRDDPMQTRL